MFKFDGCIGLFVASFLFFGVADAQANYHNYYVCPKYAGGIGFGDGVLGLQLFDERPKIGEVSGGRHMSLSRFEYEECGSEKFNCISRKKEGLAFIVDIPIVVPKIIDVEVKYEYMGLTIEARPVVRERFGRRRAVQIVAQRLGDLIGDWYSLTVVEGFGVVDFYMENAHATRASTGDPLDVNGLTCYLDSEKGFFTNAKIRKFSSSTLF